MITHSLAFSFKGTYFKWSFHLLWTILLTITAKAQTHVSLRDKISSPEIYMMVKLQDTILAARQGLGFDNYASVRFLVDKEGQVSSIAFSIYTDSLVMPHLINVLLSTNGKWQVRRNGKAVREKVAIVMPVIFVLKSRLPIKGKTEEDPLGHPPLQVVDEGVQMFHFSTDRTSDYNTFVRSGEKFEGIVLNPTIIRVPQSNDQRY